MHVDDVEPVSSVDCATFRVNEFRLDPSITWFDYKTHSCGMEYERAALGTYKHIQWVSTDVACTFGVQVPPSRSLWYVDRNHLAKAEDWGGCL